MFRCLAFCLEVPTLKLFIVEWLLLLCPQTWPDLEEKLHKMFVTFAVDTKAYTRPVTSISRKEGKVSHGIIPGV